MGAYEDLLRQRLGQPVDAAAQQMGQGADAAVQKLLALQNFRQQMPKEQPQMQRMQQQTQQAATQDLPYDPNKDAAAIATGDMWEKIRQHDAQMKAQMDAEDAQRAKDEAEFDPSQYQDVPKTKFGGLKNKLNNEDEDENTRGSTRDVGTLGGV